MSLLNYEKIAISYLEGLDQLCSGCPYLTIEVGCIATRCPKFLVEEVES